MAQQPVAPEPREKTEFLLEDSEAKEAPPHQSNVQPRHGDKYDNQNKKAYPPNQLGSLNECLKQAEFKDCMHTQSILLRPIKC